MSTSRTTKRSAAIKRKVSAEILPENKILSLTTRNKKKLNKLTNKLMQHTKRRLKTRDKAKASKQARKKQRGA